MTDYTAGPWKRDRWSIFGNDGSMVAKILPWDVSGSRSEDHANANLIASAPELLQGLEMAVDALQSDNPDIQLRVELGARAAIAKAKGECVMKNRYGDEYHWEQITTNHGWVGLTDEEIDEAIKSCKTFDTYKYFRAIEAKLKEKNT